MNPLHDEIDAALTGIDHGWCTPGKAKFLADLVTRERLLHGVEIGVFTGRSLLPVALALRRLNLGGYVLGIDPYRHEKNNEGGLPESHVAWSADVPYDRFHDETQERIRSLGLSRWCGLLRAASDEAACLVGPLDYLHIDGCHSALSSCRDVEVWVPKVRAGGVVVLDDTNWEPVREARAMLRAACGEPAHSHHDQPDGSWEAYRVR